VVAPDEDCHARRRELQALLGERFDIQHVTLQVDHATDRDRLLQIERGSLGRRP
jgi:cobalt-zinc-cadmium efflux system protein